MPWDFIITGVLLVLIIAAMLWCFHKVKQPPDPSKPRLLPYNLMIAILMVLLLATLAHVVSLVTGEQVQPRRRRGM